MAAVNDKNSFDEGIVLARLSEGDQEAFRIIYERFHVMIYRAAERFLQSSALAEDVVQEVFSALWERRGELKDIRNFEAYIRIAGRNQIYTFLRKIAYEEKQKLAYGKVAESSVDDSDFAVLDQQNEELLSKIVDNLPDRQQQVFRLARNEGLSHEHIAKQLNISQGTVKNHMIRALNTIRQQLLQYADTYCVTFFVFKYLVYSYL